MKRGLLSLTFFALAASACDEKDPPGLSSGAPPAATGPAPSASASLATPAPTNLEARVALPHDFIQAESDYDPKAFDPIAFLPKAEALAHKIYSDARLVDMDFRNVRSSGFADLTLPSDFRSMYWFRSPSRSERPKDMPVGVGVEIPCMVFVVIEASGVHAYSRKFEECDQPFLDPPKCTLKYVWDEAIKLKAPPEAVAAIDYMVEGWFFTIPGVGREGRDLTEVIPDACGKKNRH